MEQRGLGQPPVGCWHLRWQLYPQRRPLATLWPSDTVSDHSSPQHHTGATFQGPTDRPPFLTATRWAPGRRGKARAKAAVPSAPWGPTLTSRSGKDRAPTGALRSPQHGGEPPRHGSQSTPGLAAELYRQPGPRSSSASWGSLWSCQLTRPQTAAREGSTGRPSPPHVRAQSRLKGEGHLSLSTDCRQGLQDPGTAQLEQLGGMGAPGEATRGTRHVLTPVDPRPEGACAFPSRPPDSQHLP